MERWAGWEFGPLEVQTVLLCRELFVVLFVERGVGSGDEVDSRKFRVNDRPRRLS